MRSALATLLLPCVVGKRRGTRPQVALRWLVHAFICTGLGGAINTALAQVSALGPPASMVAANAITNFTASAGNNRLLVVTVSHADNGTTQAYPSVAFGAQPLTQTVISSDGQSAMDSIWVLPLGTSASATVATITATPNAGALTRPTAFLWAQVFQNVNQTTPTSGPVPFGAAGGTSSLLVTSAAGDIVFDIFDAFKISSGLTSNQSAGQTLIANSGVFDLVAGGVATYPGFGSYKTSTRPGAASVTMGWTSTADVLLAAAINIKQASITAQTITFNAPPNTALSGGSVALGATASSGLTVAYTSNTTSICTISGSNAVLVAVGSCSITANQAGNGSFAAAPPVTRMFNVTCPTITVNPAMLPRGTAGTAYNQSVNASGGSGAVSFNVSAGGVPGVSLSSGGSFSGAPYLFGPFSLTVTATDSIGCTGSVLYNVNIRQNPAVHRALTDLRGR